MGILEDCRERRGRKNKIRKFAAALRVFHINLLILRKKINKTLIFSIFLGFKILKALKIHIFSNFEVKKNL